MAAVFGTFHEYYRHVVRDSAGRSLAGLIDALTTNHTAFLREPEHFDFFRERVIPQWSKRDSVEIWCAASATGEEVWTLACLLNDSLPSKHVCIQASDISNKALANCAKSGEVHRRTLRGLAARLAVALLSRRFPRRPAGYRAAPPHSRAGKVPAD